MVLYACASCTMDKPLSEQSNYVTKDIDVARADGKGNIRVLKQAINCISIGIVRLLQQAESQIFSGYSLYEVGVGEA